MHMNIGHTACHRVLGLEIRHFNFQPITAGKHRRITADMTPAEQRALFHDNAARLYRMDRAS